MILARSSAVFVTRSCWGLLALLILALSSSCGQSRAGTYSIDEAWALSSARATEMAGQLRFSFRLDPANVPTGQEIFFVITLTNTTDLPIVFREPRQNGVLEIDYYGKTVLFSVEPISKGLSIAYPGEGGFVDMLPDAIQQDMFMTLPSHSSRELRLQLPHMVRTKPLSATVFSEEYFPLPIGQYHIQLVYYNDFVGYQINIDEERRYVDLNAWVGKIEGEPMVLTITPGQ